jgi:hypothetical protein
MAPRKASKAIAESSGQGLDTVSDTSPQVLILSEPGHTSLRFFSPNW